MPEVVKTLEEWDAEIKKHSLHLKFDTQLFLLEESIEAKIPRINRDLMEILFFPDAKKKEICENYIQVGEVTNYFDMETPVPISTEDKERIDAEYAHEVEFYTKKVSWLKDKLTCCQKEMELRADGLVERVPKGTPYFVDFDNGHDVDNDGTTATKTNGDGPWATLDKATADLTAGDVATVRRGMTQAVSQDLEFANDGTIVNPITITGDNANTTWTGAAQDETVAGETATLTFGSKTVTFANDISGDIAAHDWIYEATEDNTLFAYEVESVGGGSNEVVTLYLPYKGNISGAGKTINIMPDNPIWNTAAGSYQWNLAGDNFWMFQSLHIRGADANGQVEVDGAYIHLFKDCIFEGNGGSHYGLKLLDDQASVILRKTRFYNNYMGIYCPGASGSAHVKGYDLLFDGNNIANSMGLNRDPADSWFMYECEFKNHGGADVQLFYTDSAGYTFLRTPILGSAVEIGTHTTRPMAKTWIEDHDGTLGDNRQLDGLSNAVGTPTLQSDTTDVRGGGGATSIKVTPSANLDTDWDFSRVLLFEYPIYAVKDVAKTYTAYFKLPAANFTAAPDATTLWIEVEYWGHGTNVHRKVLKSTGTVAADGTWDPLTVTPTPLQTGVAYVRGYYCKTKEGGDSNIFFCDTVIGVA